MIILFFLSCIEKSWSSAFFLYCNIGYLFSEINFGDQITRSRKADWPLDYFCCCSFVSISFRNYRYIYAVDSGKNAYYFLPWEPHLFALMIDS